MTSNDMARALAWLGIGLGIGEIVAPRAVAAGVGVPGQAGIVAAFGWREVLSGALVLAAAQPRRRLWLRLAGDALDGALLIGGALDRRTRVRALVALAAVTPVVIADFAMLTDAGKFGGDRDPARGR